MRMIGLIRIPVDWLVRTACAVIATIVIIPIILMIAVFGVCIVINSLKARLHDGCVHVWRRVRVIQLHKLDWSGST